MIPFNIPVTISRSGVDGVEVVAETKAIIGSKIDLPLTTDVEEGDLVEWTLPNGKVKTVRATHVKHLVSPFPGASQLDHIVVQFEAATAPKPIERPRLELAGLHPDLPQDVADLYGNGLFRQAIAEAFQAVETRVQRLAGSTDSGTSLMGAVFGASTPRLDVAKSTSTRNAKDEREGFKLLFMGAMLGIRNPHGHGTEPQDDPQDALECLALASLLMRRLDVAEQRLA